MDAPPFYNTLYGINYSLPNVTKIVAVSIDSVVRVEKQATIILTYRVSQKTKERLSSACLPITQCLTTYGNGMRRMRDGCAGISCFEFG